MTVRWQALASMAVLCVLGFSVLVAVGQPAGSLRLVVLVVVDQLRYDYLTRFSGLYEGGFRRLLEQGALFTEARYLHGMNVTAAGHATISTGLHPSKHGIAANNWHDPSQSRSVNAVDDPGYQPLGGPGRNASPETLFADTIGDRLKRKNPRSKVVGVSTKDRAAILLAGREADAAYWYSNDCGCFITSSYYFEEAPSWLRAFNEPPPADAYERMSWRRLLDDPGLYEERSREDAFAAEFDGKNITFPHRVAGGPPEARYYATLRRKPQADELVLKAALEAMRFHELGADDAPDLFAIGFSSTDYVGHDYGPFSQEAMDQHLRLDGLLGELFSALEEQVGLERVLVVLTADHGVVPLVEESLRQGLPGLLVPGNALPEAVNRAVAEHYPNLGSLVAYFDAPHIYLDLKNLQNNGVKRSEVEALGKEALLATGFVEEVFTHDDLEMRSAAADDLYLRLYRNSFYAPRSPHLIVRLKEYHYVEGSQGTTGHISPYDYDRHVPIFFLGPGIEPGKHSKACGPEDIAPTLATFLNLSAPVEPDGRRLSEIIP